MTTGTRSATSLLQECQGLLNDLLGAVENVGSASVRNTPAANAARAYFEQYPLPGTRSERTFSDREAILKREERERADKKQDGATTVWGPELQNRPGGPIYRLGTSTGVTLPPQPERVTNTRNIERPEQGSMEEFAEACQVMARIVDTRNSGDAVGHLLAYRKLIREREREAIARSSTSNVEALRSALEDAVAAKDAELAAFRKNLGRDPLVKVEWLDKARAALALPFSASSGEKS